MDNKESSKFVSTKSDGARSAAAVSRFGRKKRRKKNDDGDDDSSDDEQEHTLRRAKQQEQPSKSRAKTENVSGIIKENTGDSTYRDRAKERREGIKNAMTAEQEDSWLSPTAPSDTAAAEEEEATTTTTTPRFVSAADAKFEAVIRDFETQHSTTTHEKVSKQRHDAKAESSSVSSSLLPHRGLFATADQARQWVDGKLPALPAPQSDTAKRLVECYLRKTTTTTTKPIEATPQHFSLHRAYYTFGTQWNPWWERPVVNTFLDDGSSSSSRYSNRRPWEPFSAEILVQVGESCRRIAQREAERQQRTAAAVSKGRRDDDAITKTAVAEQESSSDEDDDIFAGAGDYDAVVAIHETPAAKNEVATSAAVGGGASIFEVVAKNHHPHDASFLPEPKPEGDDGIMRPLHGFRETLDTAVGVDMDYEVADTDPKKKKKKKRRKKGHDEDSD